MSNKKNLQINWFQHNNHLNQSKISRNIDKKKHNYVGDIAISFEIINSRSKKSNFILEFDKVWIHGLLHLIGYDHIKNKDYLKMIKTEKKILTYINKNQVFNLTHLLNNKFFVLFLAPFLLGSLVVFSLPPFSFTLVNFFSF